MIAQETVEQVPIGKVKPAPDNVRDNIGDVSELAMSIQDGGIQQPLVAVQRNGHFEVVFGHRRLAAAELAGAETVPVIVREYSEPDRVLAMATENLQRENLSPLEEARAYKRLLDVCGCSQRDLAPRIGKTQSHISKRLALLELPKDVQSKVDSGGITIPDALELAKLAGHPKRLKKALDSSPWQSMSVRVSHQLDEIKLEEKIAKLEEAVESRGIASIRVQDTWSMPAGVHRLKGGSAHDTNALEITTAKHENEPCHAIAITKFGDSFPVCTNRKNHPTAKTVGEKNREKVRTAGGTTFKAPPEDKTTKQLREAREARRAFLPKMLAKKAPKEALDLVLLAYIDNELEYLDADDVERIAIALGIIDAPPEDADAETVIDGAIGIIANLCTKSSAELQRVAAAFAVDAIEKFNGVDNRIRAGASGALHMRELSPIIPYLSLLRAQGHELHPLEQKVLDDEAAPLADAA